MKSNTIWWIVLIVVVLLGVYFLVVNRQQTPSPLTSPETVTPDTTTPVDTLTPPAPSAPSDGSAPAAPSEVNNEPDSTGTGITPSDAAPDKNMQDKENPAQPQSQGAKATQ